MPSRAIAFLQKHNIRVAPFNGFAEEKRGFVCMIGAERNQGNLASFHRSITAAALEGSANQNIDRYRKAN
jgi:hypothetical protein